MKTQNISNLSKTVALALAVGFAGFSTAACSANIAQPDLSTLSTFVAKPPYTVFVQGVPQAVDLGGVSRTFDFVGIPFVNPITKVSDGQTLQSWNPVKTTLAGSAITNSGMPLHIEKIEKTTLSGNGVASEGRWLKLAILTGDNPVAGKCRAQMTSFALPTFPRENNKVVYWDYTVQFGSKELGQPWTLTQTGISPVVIAGIAPPDVGGSGAMSISADTDPLDPSKLMLIFGYRGGMMTGQTRVGEVHYIEPNKPVSIVMEAMLDERETANGGQGYWRGWVNGNLVVTVDGPTLLGAAKKPHQWSIANYMYNDPLTSTISRHVYFQRARLLTK